MSLIVACGLKREAAIIRRVGIIPVIGGGAAAALENRLEDVITAYASEGSAFDAVLSCGVAGALAPSLKAGDLVIGTVVHPASLAQGAREAGTSCDSGFTRGQEGESRAIDRLAACLPHAHRGDIVGADAIVSSASEKAALHARTGALAVDMESHVARRVASRHGLPFAFLRTISDTADHVLPPAALVGMAPDGGMALGAVLSSLARHPHQLPALLRTGRDAARAFRTLKIAIDTLADGDLTTFLTPRAAPA